MIEIVEGEGVGSGKSFYVLTRLLKHWSRGGTVCVSESYVVYWDRIKAWALDRHGLAFEDDQLRVFKGSEVTSLHESTPPGTDECPVLIVVDEAQDQLNSRETMQQGKRALFSWCCQSRHDNNDLIFVTQSGQNIDVQIRRLATFVWRIRNSRNWNIPGLGSIASMIQLFSAGLNNGWYFVANQYDQAGKNLQDRQWIKADHALLNLYKSKSMALSRKRGGEIVGPKTLRRVKGRNPMLKYVVLAFVCAGLFAAWRCVGYWRDRDKPPTVSSSASAKPGPPLLRESRQASAYDIAREGFRGSDSSTWLHTSTGLYEVGSMCGRGMVQQILGRVARVQQPSGRLLFIVAEDEPRPPLVVTPAPTPDQRILVADWKPNPSPRADAEENRVRAELSRPIGANGNSRASVKRIFP